MNLVHIEVAANQLRFDQRLLIDPKFDTDFRFLVLPGVNHILQKEYSENVTNPNSGGFLGSSGARLSIQKRLG